MKTAELLAGIASKVGAPVVRGILERYLGGTAAELGMSVIDAIAQKADVPPAELPSVDEKTLGKAVRAVEEDAPELIVATLEHHRLAAELMKEEMDKGPLWTWAWRPGGMYLIGLFWALYVFVFPLLNLMLRLAGTEARVDTLVTIDTLVYISGGFMTLYMGGNTLLRSLDKWGVK